MRKSGVFLRLNAILENHDKGSISVFFFLKKKGPFWILLGAFRGHLLLCSAKRDSQEFLFKG